MFALEVEARSGSIQETFVGNYSRIKWQPATRARYSLGFAQRHSRIICDSSQRAVKLHLAPSQALQRDVSSTPKRVSPAGSRTELLSQRKPGVEVVPLRQAGDRDAGRLRRRKESCAAGKGRS